jgi:hypothetical protein
MREAEKRGPTAVKIAYQAAAVPLFAAVGCLDTRFGGNQAFHLFSAIRDDAALVALFLSFTAVLAVSAGISGFILMCLESEAGAGARKPDQLRDPVLTRR